MPPTPSASHTDGTNFLGASNVQPELDPVVGSQHQGAAEAANQLGDQALVHALEALLRHHLREAVDPAAVEPLGSWLLRVEHHAPPDRIEGVVEGRGDGTRHRGADERGDDADNALVLLVRVHVHDLREETELPTAVDKSASHRHGRATVEARDAALLDRLLDAISDAVELPLSAPKIRRQARTREV